VTGFYKKQRRGYTLNIASIHIETGSVQSGVPVGSPSTGGRGYHGFRLHNSFEIFSTFLLIHRDEKETKSECGDPIFCSGTSKAGLNL
jgi:hypothetical protein